MPLVFAAITPHPPIIVPGVGNWADREKCAQTISAMEKLAQLLAASQPEVLLIISPHAPIDPESFLINAASSLTISLEEFHVSLPRQEALNDLALVAEIRKALAANTGLPGMTIKSPQLDHGTVVPLSFSKKLLGSVKLVSLSYSLLPLKTHHRYGQQLAAVINQYPKRVAVIASGDLSHRLTREAPAGFSPLAQKFDDHLVKAIREADWSALINIPSVQAEEAGECGWRSFAILSGILEGRKTRADILSYEGPFGVGYLVANFKL